jgi:hypothetical protein
MTSDQLTQILAEAQLALQQNKALVTPDLLDQIQQLAILLGSAAASPTTSRLLAGYRLNLPTIVTALQALVAHERILIAGMQDTILTSIQTLQGRPLEVDMIAKFL